MKFLCKIPFIFLFFFVDDVFSQGVVFHRDISPAEGWVKPLEKSYRGDICLNGRWDFQPIDVPKNWEYGKGVPPELPFPKENGWKQ